MLGRLIGDRRALAQIVVGLATLATYRQLFLFDSELYAPLPGEPLEEWFFASSGNSPWLIYGLTVWFAIRRRHSLSVESVGGGALIIGTGGTLLALGLILWSYFTSAFQVLPPSLAILLVSIGLVLGGFKGGRSFLLPAGFVALLGTPIPTPLLNQVMYPMQLWTADVSVAILRFVGHPVLASGDMIITRWGTFQVIETCAGLRSMLTLLMAAYVYCELIGHTGRRRWILTLAAPFIGILANLARVQLLVFNPVPESQPGHSLQGLLMMVLGILLLWGLDEALDLLSSRPTMTEPPSTKSETASVAFAAGERWRLASLVALITVCGIGTTFIHPPTFSIPREESIHRIPRVLGPWTTGQDPLVVDAEYLGSTRFSTLTWREYRRGDDYVTLFAGTDDHLKRINGIVSEKTKTLQAGSFLLEDEAMVDSSGRRDSRGRHRLVIWNRDESTRLGFHWYEDTAGLWTEVLRSMFAIDRSPWRRERTSRVIQISTRTGHSPLEREQAEERLQNFSQSLEIELQNLWPKDRLPGLP